MGTEKSSISELWGWTIIVSNYFLSHSDKKSKSNTPSNQTVVYFLALESVVVALKNITASKDFLRFILQTSLLVCFWLVCTQLLSPFVSVWWLQNVRGRIDQWNQCGCHRGALVLRPFSRKKKKKKPVSDTGFHHLSLFPVWKFSLLYNIKLSKAHCMAGAQTLACMHDNYIFELTMDNRQRCSKE